MNSKSLEINDFSSYINDHDVKDLLRFITCGSVDDGKSTLIGRLLYESQMIFDDQLKALASDSKKMGTVEDNLDFALLVDGLSAEREQGITIDVAYRYFSTDKRKFIVADTPGHEQYTRNMATGASTAMLAVVLVDARKGILTQTRRHSFIVSMLGIKHVILAVNKMDLIGYDQERLNEIQKEYCKFSETLGFKSIEVIPISALKGENVTQHSENMSWYQGTTLLSCLEKVVMDSELQKKAFRMPVQWVNRPNLDFRGFAGRVASGEICPGDRVKVLPADKESEIVRIVTFDGDKIIASAGQSVTCVLKDEIDISRGDILSLADDPCCVADQFEVKLLWMADQPMVTSRRYLLKIASNTALCTVSKLKHLVDVNTMEHLAAKQLTLNEIGSCNIELDRSIAFEPYDKNRELGSFILIDRVSHETVALGFINFALYRSANVYPQKLLVDRDMRSRIKSQTPFVIWLTGLSGAGKSTIANLVELQLNALGKHTMLLDGDNIRHGLNRDLGFSDAERAENIRRIATVAKLMTEAGLISIVSCISPFAEDRKAASELIGREQFLEIFIDASLDVVMQRDVKGLYQKAKNDGIKNLTGVTSQYDRPQSPDLRIDTVILNEQTAADKIMQLLRNRKVID